MLFSFSKENKSEVSLGVILDVGSGSVGAAIVASSTLEKFPVILWSYREYFADKNSDVEIKNPLSATILNVFLELSGSGLKALRSRYPGKLPTVIQVSLNAPFAYTISRNVNTKADKPMRFNSKLISALENKAQEEARNQVAALLATKTMNMAILSEVVTSVKVDGNPIRFPYDGEGEDISLRQLISLAPTNLIAEIEAARDKVLPETEIDFDSFMSLYSRALLDIVSFKKDICLVSITARASEVMIVDGGDPYISNFTTKGHRSLAASISEASGLDMLESAGMMKENDINHASLLSKAKVANVQNVIAAYEDEMTVFIRGMSDALVIPKDIYLQIDKDYEKFFVDLLVRAFSKATGLKHTIHPFTSEFFSNRVTTDSRILCSAYIFHKKLYQDHLAEEQYLL